MVSEHETGMVENTHGAQSENRVSNLQNSQAVLQETSQQHRNLLAEILQWLEEIAGKARPWRSERAIRKSNKVFHFAAMEAFRHVAWNWISHGLMERIQMDGFSKHKNTSHITMFLIYNGRSSRLSIWRVKHSNGTNGTSSINLTQPSHSLWRLWRHALGSWEAKISQANCLNYDNFPQFLIIKGSYNCS